MFNSTCGNCGSPSYQGLISNECSNPSCASFKTDKLFVGIPLSKEEIEKAKEKLRNLVPEFAKEVAPVFQINNWAWSMTPYIPSEQQIADRANHLIDMINFELGGMFSTMSSGRITAAIYKFEEEIEVELFIQTNVHSDGFEI